MVEDAASSALRRAVGLAWVVGLSCACSPELNWREVRIEGTGVRALLPCKPSVYGRQAVFEGLKVSMGLQACTAGEVTWAIAHTRLEDPADVAPAIRALLKTSAANVGVAEPTVEPWSPPGATPQPDAGRLRASGKRPDGRPTVARSAVFAVGTVVCQASIVGSRVDEDAAAAFFAGLQVRP